MPQLAGRTLNTHSDPPDLRDRIHEPARLDLKIKLGPPDPGDSTVLNQGQKSACTGFAQAGVVNLFKARRQAKAACGCRPTRRRSVHRVETACLIGANVDGNAVGPDYAADYSEFGFLIAVSGL